MKLVSESRQVGATMRRDSSAINFHRAGWHVEINNSLSKTIHQRKVPSKMTVKKPPRWPSGKASASRAEDPGFETHLHRDFFQGRVIPAT